MIEITLDSAIEGVKALVEEYGEDFVYNRNPDMFGSRCLYVRNDSPDCLVGKFLAAQGVSLEDLQDGDEDNGMVAEALIRHLESHEIIKVAPKAIQFLQELQWSQDKGEAWGTCLKGAVSRV